MGVGSLQGKTCQNHSVFGNSANSFDTVNTLKPVPTISEDKVTDSNTGDSYIILRYEGTPYQLQVSTPNTGHEVNVVSILPMSNVPSVHFVPYFFRANYGGKDCGEMDEREAS